MGDAMTSLQRLQDLQQGPGKDLLDATQAIGFSAEVARAGLEAEFSAWNEGDTLDAMRARVAKLESEIRPKSVLVIAAGTLPASTLRHVLFARLLGAQVFLKCATGQEAIGEAIQAADPGVLATPFSREDSHALRSTIDQVDTVVALGSDTSLDDIKGHVPFHKTFVGYGHRVSAAWCDDPSPAELEGLADDLLMWDQAGCISPHILWTRTDPVQVAKDLAKQVAIKEKNLPMTLGPWAARERHVASVFGQMTGHAVATETAVIAALSTATFRPSPRHRFLWVLPASQAALEEILPKLSTLAVSGSPGVALPGHVRRCALGQMQRPPLHWAQDGDDPLLALLRAS